MLEGEGPLVESVRGQVRNVDYSRSPPGVNLIFEYNDEVLREVVEGKILTAPSFGSVARDEDIYALFEATVVKPMHITAERLMKYKFLGTVGPFLEQTAHDLMGESGDWEEIRDHAYVEVQASLLPYHMQLKEGGVVFYEGMEKPVIGSYVRPLSSRALDLFVNGRSRDGISVGSLSSSDGDVPIKVDVKKLIALHFSILGYTGHGKSNLGALLISRILKSSNAKVAIFDLSDEYTTLLADILYQEGEVLIDPDDVPKSLIDVISGESDDLEEVSHDLAERMKKPSRLDDYVESLAKVVERLISDKRLKLLSQRVITPVEMPTDAKTYDGAIGVISEHLKRRNVDDVTIVKVMRAMRKCIISKGKDLESQPEKDVLLGCLREITPQLIEGGDVEAPISRFDPKEIKVLKDIYFLLKEGERVDTREFEISDVASYLAQGDRSLYLIVSTDSSKLSFIMKDTMSKILEDRRKGVGDKRILLFVIDEAHEFAVDPRTVSGREKEVTKTIERLTRMGRKFNLGVALLSQRVAHLNTTALSNCHTMFLGALPRKYDRERAADAYSIPDDIMSQTVTFRPGEWLLLSHGAVWLKNVPLIFRAENREDELIEFLRGLEG